MKKIITILSVLIFVTINFSIVYAQCVQKEKETILSSFELKQLERIFEASSSDSLSIIDFISTNNNFSIDNDILDLSKTGKHYFDVELYSYSELTQEKISKIQTIEFEVKDTIAPKIEISDIEIYEGESPIYSVLISDEHCNCSYEIKDEFVEFNIPGVYEAHVIANDECGNQTIQSFKVTVLAKQKVWYVDTVEVSPKMAQSTIDSGSTASVIGFDNTKWVFKHAHMGGKLWYAMKPGDLLILDGITYTVTNSTTAEQSSDSYHLYLNGVDIFGGYKASTGHKVVMKTCYKGTTNWVVTAD